MSGSWYVVYFAYTNINNQCVPGVSEVEHGSGSSPYWLEQQGYQSPEERAVFINFDITYPEGYEGAIARTTMPPAVYVAMGDSFSSGEGNPPFEAGSDTSANICHRSVNAYPRLIQSDLGLDTTAFVACSGAISDYIINDYNQENVESPQAAYVSEDTSLVTITIGGNDIGFPNLMATCTGASNAQGCLDAVATAADKVEDSNFLDTLTNTFSGIRLVGGTGTQVVVIGYPQLFPAYSNISGSCTWGNSAEHVAAPDQISARTITESEVNALRSLHDSLNSVIANAVDDANDAHIHFVDPTTAFSGHELCGTQSDWINGVSLTLSTADIAAGSYHPNADGQEAYANKIEDAVANF